VSRAARRWSSWTSSALAALLLGGCGGSRTSTPRIEGPFGRGRAQAWVVRAHGRPKAVVALLHGLAPRSGLSMRPWLVHLAEQGDDVIYPRYEQPPPDPDARDGVVEGVRNGLARLGRPHAPLVLVGHSRGGRLAVEAAATLKPAAVIAVYPGIINPSFEPPTDLARIPTSTSIWLLVGDRDRGVGSAGALELFERLRAFDFPRAQIHGGVVRSTRGFVADHMSATRSDPGVRRVLWARVDRLVAQAEGA
jgi:pimeloyl-ACP methyl ester carboxylesterase